MDDLAAYLQDLERQLFEPRMRGSRQALERIISPTSREIGRSGRLYDFEEIVEALLSEVNAGPIAEAENFAVRMLGEGVALLTYRSSRMGDDGAAIRTLRSSIWRQEEDGNWRIEFHQGTPTN